LIMKIILLKFISIKNEVNEVFCLKIQGNLSLIKFLEKIKISMSHAENKKSSGKYKNN